MFGVFLLLFFGQRSCRCKQLLIIHSFVINNIFCAVLFDFRLCLFDFQKKVDYFDKLKILCSSDRALASRSSCGSIYHTCFCLELCGPVVKIDKCFFPFNTCCFDCCPFCLTFKEFFPGVKDPEALIAAYNRSRSSWEHRTNNGAIYSTAKDASVYALTGCKYCYI